MRSLSIDILKIILAAFVVCLHLHTLQDSYPRVSYVLVNGLFRIGVPVFLIISGYFFYFIHDVSKLKKWSVRILLLYIIWSVVYFPFWRKDHHDLLNIFFGYHHLWYLIGTFFAGLLLFTVRKIPVTMLAGLILVFFCSGYAVQYLANSHYFSGETDTWLNVFPTYRNFLTVCFPFLGIGFLIKKLAIDVRQKPSVFWMLVSVGLVMVEAFLNDKILNLGRKESVDILFSLLIACPVLFLYGKSITVKTDSRILASISTAIYLIHPLVIELVYQSNIITSFQNLIFTVLLIFASLILVFVNRKVKYLL